MPLSAMLAQDPSPMTLGALLLLGLPARPESKKGRTLVVNSLALGLAAFMGFWANAPEHVGTGAIAATLLIVLDTLTGIVCAAIFKEFRSRRLRERLIAKFLYYGLFVVCSYILGALLKAYWMLAACWYAVVLIELASVMETLTRLHIRGGKKFGPAEKLLQAFARAMGEAANSALPNEAEPKPKEKTQ